MDLALSGPWLRLQPCIARSPFGSKAFEVFVKFWFGLTVRYCLSRPQRVEGPSIGFVRKLLLGRLLGLDHLLFLRTRCDQEWRPSVHFRFGRSRRTFWNSSGPLTSRRLRLTWSSGLALVSLSLSIVLPAISRTRSDEALAEEVTLAGTDFPKPISTSRRMASERRLARVPHPKHRPPLLCQPADEQR